MSGLPFVKRVATATRCWLGMKLHDLGSAIYVNPKWERDDREARLWEMKVWFEGTQAQADKRYDELIEATCGRDHHPLEPCDFAGGAMGPATLRRLPDYDADEIADALDEALSECVREPRTSLWASFWDRLTQGDDIPARPTEGADDAH